MRLRARFSDALNQLVLADLPQAVATVWDARAVVVFIEQAKFRPAGGIEGDGWDRRATFEGVVRAEISADGIDDLPIEPLLARLVAPVHLPFDGAVPQGAISEKARFTLAELRSAVRDFRVISQLRFNVTGTLAEYAGPGARPQALGSATPETGPDHAAAYGPITGDEATGDAA